LARLKKFRNRANRAIGWLFHPNPSRKWLNLTISSSPVAGFGSFRQVLAVFLNFSKSCQKLPSEAGGWIKSGRLDS